MKKFKIVFLVLVGLLSLAPVYGQVVPKDNEVLRQLAEVRMATARYHDVSVALADGYLATPACVQALGLGAMGYHYVNPSLFDTNVDKMKPEALLYFATEEGFRLAGVEYVVLALANTAEGPVPWFGSAPPAGGFYTGTPSVLGHSFDGPMPGHEPEMPWHYDLHVWVWQANPSGIFALFNPKLTCP